MMDPEIIGGFFSRIHPEAFPAFPREISHKRRVSEAYHKKNNKCRNDCFHGFFQGISF
jgi:hypothetical protein